MLHLLKGCVPEAPYAVGPGQARVTASGSDVTLVGISYMQVECLRARQYLEDVGVNAEVIDPIWLSPLDIKTIVSSVQKTGRLCVVDNGWTTCGAGSEIIARVVEQLQGEPEIRVRQMGFAATTCPTAPTLEAHYYPNGRTIASAAYDLVYGDNKNWLPDERADLNAVEFKGPF
jgi:pyruvate/2-oxoglutarate/acetoin dehydrogenase E1 component